MRFVLPFKNVLNLKHSFGLPSLSRFMDDLTLKANIAKIMDVAALNNLNSAF